MSVLARVRHEAQDLFEMVLVPGVAALLPWPVSFRLFRWISRRNWLYRHACDTALAHAAARGWVHGDPAQWKSDCRLIMLIDNADYFLSRFRGDGWMRRHLDVSGEWPAHGQAAILCTFHWGAGMWALRHAGSMGRTPHALVAQHVASNFPGRTVQYTYYGARNRENTRALGTEPIEATGHPRTVLRALRNQEQLMAAVDVPSDQAAASEPVSVLGLSARVPRGLFRIAADTKVPMYAFLTGVRMSDGQRTLHIQRIKGDDQRELMDNAFSLLDQAIRSNPPAWHFWKVAPRFFDQPPAGRGD